MFLIDEAHNLVERGREMYSAAIYKEDILSIRRLIKTEAPKLAKRLEECNKQLLELKKECETYQIQESVSHIALKLMNVIGRNGKVSGRVRGGRKERTGTGVLFSGSGFPEYL